MAVPSVMPTRLARPSIGRYKIWEVKDLKNGQRSFLKNLDTKGAINICSENEECMQILVEGTRSLQLEKMLRDRDISFEIMGAESGSLSSSTIVRMRSPRRNIPKILSTHKYLRSKETMDWKDFYPLQIVYNWMDEIERMFPATCTVYPIGKTVEGRPIKMLKISNSDASNTAVWLDGCIHAREWITVPVVTYIADHIARNFNKLPRHLTNKDWYFVPIVNPDGFHHSHTVDRMWRKNRGRFGNTIVGVDLNRNFGQNWGQCGIDGIPLGDPNHHNYRGQEPFSEPETAAIKDVILYSGTPFKIFISFHSFSEVISFPWCNTSEPCPDYVNMLEGGAVMAKAIYDTTGRMYKVGNFKDVMYFASGTSIDWSYGTAKIPFSYLIELRSKEHRFTLPKDEIGEVCKEGLAAVTALAEFVEKTKCLNCNIFNSKLQQKESPKKQPAIQKKA